jgi:hypothetical protein
LGDETLPKEFPVTVVFYGLYVADVTFGLNTGASKLNEGSVP